MSPESLLWDEPVPGERSRLRASRCTACGRFEFPAAERCLSCGEPPEPVALGPNARLGPRTAVLHAPPGGLIEVPYLVGVAEFPEGISVLGLLDAATLEDAATGDAVETVAAEVAPGLVTYAFRPP